MLFRLFWDEKTGKTFSWPAILVDADRQSEDGGLPRSLWCLSPAVPYFFLEDIHKRSSYASKEKIINKLNGRGEGGAGGYGREAGSWKWEPRGVAFSSAPLHSTAYHLSTRTSQRQIADTEVLRLARESGCSEAAVWLFLQREVEEGRGVWLAAVGGSGWNRVCRRCGCRSLAEWPSHFGWGYTCNDCAALGAVSSLNVLWRYQEEVRTAGDRSAKVSPEGVPPDDVLVMPFALSQAQEMASREVESFEGNRMLIWAACGAGKTEVCFARIARALQEGKRVLFAAPRRDVISDIVPRLEAAFPQVEKTMLSGASAERFGGGRLVAATTHQVARFFRAFDLIVLDELDAYPFTAEAFLHRALDQALRPGGCMICLTATPHREILRDARAKRCGLVQLPARYHRKPLPVPLWQKCPLPSWEEGRSGQTTSGRTASGGTTSWRTTSGGTTSGRTTSRRTRNLGVILEGVGDQGRILFFVPRVADVTLWIGWLNPLLPGRRIGGSWSSDPERAAKVEALKAGEFDVFVTTTILERGITLDNVQVVVVWADHPLFDERTLVQMAGRAGRKRDNPYGSVLFLAERCSKAMEEARRWIMEQNGLAQKLGLIDL
ncbi:MAG: DEAD/DEAH box helicase family protein [Peptococcaceae bacterium]|nr:DEAD/DEAH box helicase family protein [Peptococcaceae bacterium]